MATVRYLVHHVPAATAFYVDHLGFELIQAFGPAMAIVRRSDLSLWLAGPMASAARPMPDGRQPEHPREFLATIVLGPHVQHLPEPLRDPFMDEVMIELGEPVIVDYVRLNINATA